MRVAILTLLVVTVEVTICSTVSEAAVQRWGVSFFDTNGTLVDTICFSFDPATTDSYDIDPAPDPDLFYDTNFGIFDVTGSLITLDLNTPAWWEGGGSGIGHVGISRSGPFLAQGHWFFGDPFEGVPGQANMFPDGTWHGYVLDNLGNQIVSSGTWTAFNKIPSPSTAMLFSTALLVSVGRINRGVRIRTP